jgi:hemolysin III
MTWLDFREPVSAWTHFVWMMLTLPATWLLWRLARGSLLKRLGVLIFGTTCALCYAGSWLYHAVPEAIVGPFHAFDHVAIYLFIAGTVTPIGLVVLRGWWRFTLLSTIWLLALCGVVMRLSADLPVQTLTLFYLVMGWIGLLTYFELARQLSHATLRPIWIGGVFYTVGAVINTLHWPVLAPGVFGSHELFHLFVMAGSGWHYYFLLVAVVAHPMKGVVPAPGKLNASLTRRLSATLKPAPAVETVRQ